MKNSNKGFGVVEMIVALILAIIVTLVLKEQITEGISQVCRAFMERRW